MVELRPIPIVLISFYCFLLGLSFFSLTANTIFSNNEYLLDPDLAMWSPVIFLILLATLLIIVGTGILYFNQWCWKILFFYLIICIATIASFILIYVNLLWINPNLVYQIQKIIQITPVIWFSFVFFLLTGVLVLYFLTDKEVVSHFGDMGDLLDPF